MGVNKHYRRSARTVRSASNRLRQRTKLKLVFLMMILREALIGSLEKYAICGKGKHSFLMLNATYNQLCIIIDPYLNLHSSVEFCNKFIIANYCLIEV